MTIPALIKAIQAGTAQVDDWGLDANGLIEIGPTESERYAIRARLRAMDEK